VAKVVFWYRPALFVLHKLLYCPTRS
jgi:hypothetical protein